jgi:hypothetical protein
MVDWLVGWLDGRSVLRLMRMIGGWLIGWLWLELWLEWKRSVPTFRLLRMIGECKVRKEGKKRREDEEEERISRV